ncbi:hypothetical protein [Pedobacter mucosus]|uniref:hypothetical protein n=1 Tax=Pedobacter mucosus TaxID=2895286 RepID=UPI001EE45FF6|nr:hypothetical protein [Pedobacter mucosus]UKT65152.1 hypothetical protein LOK61_05075 [Pedobacter mucosus]
MDLKSSRALSQFLEGCLQGGMFLRYLKTNGSVSIISAALLTTIAQQKKLGLPLLSGLCKLVCGSWENQTA